MQMGISCHQSDTLLCPNVCSWTSILSKYVCASAWLMVTIMMPDFNVDLCRWLIDAVSLGIVIFRTLLLQRHCDHHTFERNDCCRAGR